MDALGARLFKLVFFSFKRTVMGVCVCGGGCHDRKRLPSFYFASGHVTGLSLAPYRVLLGFSTGLESAVPSFTGFFSGL